MRIACLQFAPQVGDIDNNLNRADAILNRADPKDLDLLVLPELAFTGYNFKSLQQIAPFLEPPGTGITSLWARTTALKHDCTVLAGYPEKVDPTLKWPTDPEYYNSATVVNRDGETTVNYRKSHLYYTDETWALEGQGFFAGRLPGLGKTAIGICMDINPYKFQVPWHDFEFAHHVLDNHVRLVIVSMAWITQEEPQVYTQTPDEPDMETLTYWLARLDPVVRAEPDHEIIVVFANRCGQEDNATYAGTSAVVGIKGKDVRVYGILGRGQKDLLVVDTNDQPYAKLVFRPAEKVSSSDEEPASSEASSHAGPTNDLETEEVHAAAEKSTRRRDASAAEAVDAENTRSFRRSISGSSSQDVNFHEKPGRRSTLVEFSPVADGRSFFDDEGSPITPTYEEQPWWPSPFSQSTHRRYHSASSIGPRSKSSRGNRIMNLRNRNSIGSTLSDKTLSKQAAKWASTSSMSSREYGDQGFAKVGYALSMMEEAQCGSQNDLCTDFFLDEFLKPSNAGIGTLSVHHSQHSSRRSERNKNSKPTKIRSGSHLREAPFEPWVEDPSVERGSSAEDTSIGKRANSQPAVGNTAEAWLSKSEALSGQIRQRGASNTSGLRKTKARKERPSYINDWDEPRSYSPMEFRTPRAMTFEEIGALTAAPVST